MLLIKTKSNGYLKNRLFGEKIKYRLQINTIKNVFKIGSRKMPDINKLIANSTLYRTSRQEPTHFFIRYLDHTSEMIFPAPCEMKNLVLKCRYMIAQILIFSLKQLLSTQLGFFLFSEVFCGRHKSC